MRKKRAHFQNFCVTYAHRTNAYNAKLCLNERCSYELLLWHHALDILLNISLPSLHNKICEHHVQKMHLKTRQIICFILCAYHMLIRFFFCKL